MVKILNKKKTKEYLGTLGSTIFGAEYKNNIW